MGLSMLSVLGYTSLQVANLRSLLSLRADYVKTNCDAVSIRGFISYLVHRHDGSVRRDLQPV